ncbi:hypothetical protein HDA32_003697 [Spinactinospora alkalitolerans]|uniref:Effector-associated domain-containing protein n=1 Tax=Spinactinospora alkalitolerans TaxID=687207 RepID=A0A852TZ43_9ACTN|nr:trypsin-like peptidase domain-containing protein [Spinactinospora alkalitolerans]NYE48577.1 hypothetical protein [Spinactinospora alkalitolerans]
MAEAPRRPPATWQLRVLADAGALPLGAAVLVDAGRADSADHAGLALTCAHVLDAAVPADPPGREVLLDSPSAAPGWSARARVARDGWFVGRSPWDVAVLRITTGPVPDALRAARLGRSEGANGRIGACGYPRAVPLGLWAYTVPAGPGGPYPGCVQIDGERAAGARVTAGFSGAGAQDLASGAVIGLVSHAYRGTDHRTGWMIPMELIAGACPAVAHRLAARGRGGAASAPPPRIAARIALARALGEVPTLTDPQRRSVFVRYLDARIRGRVAAGAQTDVFAHGLVQCCDDYDGALLAALSTLAALEEDSAPMRGVWSAAEPFLAPGRDAAR